MAADDHLGHQFRPVYETRHGSARVSPDGYVSNVFVRDSSRGSGHGTNLMRLIIADADRIGKPLTLHAREDLHPWYARLGFEEVARDFDDRSGLSMPRLQRSPYEG